MRPPEPDPLPDVGRFRDSCQPRRETFATDVRDEARARRKRAGKRVKRARKLRGRVRQVADATVHEARSKAFDEAARREARLRKDQESSFAGERVQPARTSATAAREALRATVPRTLAAAAIRIRYNHPWRRFRLRRGAALLQAADARTSRPLAELATSLQRCATETGRLDAALAECDP